MWLLPFRGTTIVHACMQAWCVRMPCRVLVNSCVGLYALGCICTRSFLNSICASRADVWINEWRGLALFRAILGE